MNHLILITLYVLVTVINFFVNELRITLNVFNIYD